MRVSKLVPQLGCGHAPAHVAAAARQIETALGSAGCDLHDLAGLLLGVAPRGAPPPPGSTPAPQRPPGHPPFYAGDVDRITVDNLKSFYDVMTPNERLLVLKADLYLQALGYLDPHTRTLLRRLHLKVTTDDPHHG